MSFGARALIRLGALEHNLDVIRAAAPGSRIMAVIKANAYGHGMVPVAQHLSQVDAFAVARVPEALELRDHGITQPIVLLAGVMNTIELASAMQHGFEPVVQVTRSFRDVGEASRGDHLGGVIAGNGRQQGTLRRQG